MGIRFAPSARRHGIADSEARYVVEHCVCPLYPPADDDRDLVLFLGPNSHGIPLEVAGIELADGDLLIIHAMKMRKAYQADYERVMRCSGR